LVRSQINDEPQNWNQSIGPQKTREKTRQNETTRNEKTKMMTKRHKMDDNKTAENKNNKILINY